MFWIALLSASQELANVLELKTYDTENLLGTGPNRQMWKKADAEKMTWPPDAEKKPDAKKIARRWKNCQTLKKLDAEKIFLTIVGETDQSF